MSLLSIAINYRDSGLSVIPCFRKGKDKRPLISARYDPKMSWRKYQKELITDEALAMSYEDGANALGVVCGMISGGLELLDFDLRNDPENTVWDPLFEDLVEYFGGLFPLPVIRTPSGGFHIYFRSETPGRNQPLVKLKKEGGAVVETRGEGGLFLISPSPGYEHVAGPTIENTPTVSSEQRDDILSIVRKYNKVYEEARKKPSAVKSSSYAVTPWDQYNEDTTEPWRDILYDAGWTRSVDGSGKDYTDTEGREHWRRPGSENKTSANWDPSRRLFYVFTSSTVFENENAYTPVAILAYLKHNGDFSEAVKEIRAAGYGRSFTETEEQFIGKASGLLDKIPDFLTIINMLSFDWEKANPELDNLAREERQEKISKDLTILVEAAQVRKDATTGLFWSINNKGRVSINSDGLKLFLRNNGFKLFSQEDDSALYRIIRIDKVSRVVEEVPLDCMMKWVEEWFSEHWEEYEVAKDDLTEALTNYKGWGHIALWINRISVENMKFLRDTRTDTYLPFKNAIIHITKDEIKPIEYHELPDGMLVWKKQIKPVVINVPDLPPGTDDTILNNCPVFRFYKRIAGIGPELEYMPLPELKASHPDLYTNIMAFMTSTGYLLNNFKDPGRPYMIMLGENTASEKEGGGAGKDLYVKTLKWIRGVTLLPGKQWKPSANFAFQTYRLGDDILYIADAEQRMDFKAMYNVITEGLPIEKKNKDALMLPYELSPKVCVSTNYYIDKSSNHAKRRIRELLFAKYYSDDGIRVEDELGGLFWNEQWTDYDWTMFYLLMFTCIQTFLGVGIVRFGETENMKSKTIKLQYGNEFFEFMHDLIKDESGKWIAKLDLYEQFLVDSGTEKKYFGSRRFSGAVEAYCQFFGIKVSEARNKSRSGGERDKKYLIFTLEGQPIPNIGEQLGSDAPF